MMTDTYPGIPVARDRKEALPFVRYDHYLEDSSREIFRDGSKPLKEFLKMRFMVATPSCNSVREGRLFLAGEEISPHHRVATEHGKKYTRSILKDLWQNEKNGKCFSDFNEQNMYATRSGRAKFYGVRRMNHTGVQAKRNYNSAHDIITALFSNSKGEGIPDDIKHLLNLIKNYPVKAGLYHIHASLLPLSKRQAAYFMMYEQLTYKMDEDEQERIRLKLPYIEDWRKRLKGNRLLERIYFFKPKKYEVSEPTQQQHQLTFEQQLEQRRKRKTEDSLKMVTYLRHRTAHRMDDYKKEQALGKLNIYQAEDSELVALVRYPLVFCRLQEELYESKELEELKMDELF